MQRKHHVAYFFFYYPCGLYFCIGKRRCQILSRVRLSLWISTLLLKLNAGNFTFSSLCKAGCHIHSDCPALAAVLADKLCVCCTFFFMVISLFDIISVKPDSFLAARTSSTGKEEGFPVLAKENEAVFGRRHLSSGWDSTTTASLFWFGRKANCKSSAW